MNYECPWYGNEWGKGRERCEVSGPLGRCFMLMRVFRAEESIAEVHPPRSGGRLASGTLAIKNFRADNAMLSIEPWSVACGDLSKLTLAYLDCDVWGYNNGKVLNGWSTYTRNFCVLWSLDREVMFGRSSARGSKALWSIPQPPGGPGGACHSTRVALILETTTCSRVCREGKGP